MTDVLSAEEIAEIAELVEYRPLQGGAAMKRLLASHATLVEQLRQREERVAELEAALRDVMLSDPEFVAGIERGLEARRKGLLKPWDDLKRELGITMPEAKPGP